MSYAARGIVVCTVVVEGDIEIMIGNIITSYTYLEDKIWNCLRNGRSRFFYQFIRRVLKETSNYRGITLLSRTYKFYTISCSLGEFQTQTKLLRVTSMDFDATGQLLILYSAFVNYLRKNGNKMKQSFG